MIIQTRQRGEDVLSATLSNQITISLITCKSQKSFVKAIVSDPLNI